MSQNKQQQELKIDSVQIDPQEIAGLGMSLKDQAFKKAKNKKIYIVTFVGIFPIFCFFLEFLWLHDIVENTFERRFSLFVTTVTLFLSLISYYQSITISNKATYRPNVPQLSSTIIDPLQKEQKTCQKCNGAWKPPKSHHCSTCGGCQVGMDHHCPWIVNCVGYRNHRAFYLFTLYMTIGGIHYCYRSWNYFIYLYDQDEPYFSHHSYFMYFLWGFTSLFIFPGSVLLIGLTVFHTLMVLTRLTTLDMISGGSLSFPFLPDMAKSNKINPYDRGVLQNLNILFNGDLFFFWLPRETIGENDGIQLFRSPYCNLSDIRSVVGKQEQANLSERVDVHKMINDLDKLIEQEKEKYKDFNFQVNGKIYEFWKDLENQNESNNNKEEQNINYENNQNKIDEWKKDAEILQEDDDQF